MKLELGKIKTFLQTHLSSLRFRLLALLGVGFGALLTVGCAFADSASATTSNVTDIVLEWMPLIIVFMMLGLIMGIMKKMSRW
jgi:hypothetical protein